MEKLREELNRILCDPLVGALRGTIEEAGVTAHIVGGTVRDMILGREICDLDVVVDREAMETASAFARRTGGAFIPLDEEHQIARVVVNRSRTFDFALMRGSIDEDLALRDFPINAMALAFADGAFRDPLGGVEDVRARRLRIVSERSFTDDPLRMVRAFRLGLELSLSLDYSVFESINHHAPLIDQVSKERVRDELFRILKMPSFPTIVAMADCGLLFELFPGLGAQKDLEQGEYHHLELWDHTLFTFKSLEELLRAPDAFLPGIADRVREHLDYLLAADRDRRANLKLCALLHDVGKPHCRREENGRVSFLHHEREGAALVEKILGQYRMSTREIEYHRRIVERHLVPIQLARSVIEHRERSYRSFFRSMGEEAPDVLLLSWADLEASRGPLNGPDALSRHHALVRELLDLYFHGHSLAKPVRWLSGDDIMSELHVPRGPRVGELLAQLEEASALGEVSSREEALALARLILTGS